MNNEAYPNFKQFLLLVALFYTSFTTFFIIVTILGTQLFDSFPAFYSFFRSFLMPVGSPICYIPLIIYVGRKSSIPLKWKITVPQINFVLILVLLATATVIITQPLIYPVDYFRNLIGGRFRFIALGMPKVDLLFVIKFISIVFIAPVFEEIFFRRQIFGLLLKKYSPAVAMVLSSVLFAFAHGRIYDVGSLFIWGLLFCFVYYKTNSIELSILLHSISNVHSFIVRRVFIDIKEIQFPKYILITVISAVVAYLVISFMSKWKDEYKGHNDN